MSETLTLKRRIFDSGVATSAILVNFLITAWLMRSGLAEDYWGIWRVTLVIIPFVAVVNLIPDSSRDTGSYWEWAITCFGSNVLASFLVIALCIFQSLYHWQVSLPSGDTILLFTTLSGFFTARLSINFPVH